MKKETIKYEYIKSMKLAAYLMLQGFRILDIQKDKSKPEFDVYCFRQTKELTNAVFKYISNKNGGNINGAYNKDSENESQFK